MIDLDKHHIKYDDDEPTWKLKHRLTRVLANKQTESKVKFVKFVIQIITLAIEKGACHFMPRCRLEGWSNNLNKDLTSGNFDTTLEQAYRKFWSKGPPNPLVYLAIVIVGSAK